MEKLLLGIHATMVNKCWDAFVPADVEISQLTLAIAKGVSELTGGEYKTSGHEMLSLQEPECLLDPSRTLDDYNIKDGMQLFLV